MLFVLFAILSPHKARDIFSVHWLHWLHLKTTYLNFTSFSAATTRSWQGEETYDVSCELLRGNVSRWRLTKISLMVSWYRKHNIIPVYYMASSASGQDEQNRALWLATRAGKMERSCLLGTTRWIPQAKLPQKPYNKSFIDHVCSVKMAGYWPRSFVRVYGPRLRLGP